MSSAVSTLTSLMGLQLFTRLFTFLLNQALFRMASPKAYGVAAIQFELVISTILFLSREGVRGALIRVKPANKTQEGIKEGNEPNERSRSESKVGPVVPGNTAMNVGFVPIIIGIPLAIATSLLYANSASLETQTQSYFKLAVTVYGLAAIMELLAEPMHNMAMIGHQTHIRVHAEGVGITCKTLVTFFVLLYDSSKGNGDLALMAFALGQLSYGSCVFLVYLTHYRGRGMPVLGRILPDSSGRYFDKDTLSLSMTMTSQSVVKHFLTEGDKIILSWFSPLQDQGGYALAVNYGSLIARIVFQPIEETLRLTFSQTLAEVTSSSANRTGNNSQDSIEPSQHRPALSAAARTLTLLLQIQITGSIFVIVFGSNYISLVLSFLLPAQYLKTSAPDVLKAWIWYIPVLAVNGGLEAFLASVASARDVNRQSRWMVLFSVIYICSAIALYKLQLGDAALVYANIINLSARIIYTMRFSSTFFASHKAKGLLNWRDTLPSWKLVLALLASVMVIRTSESSTGATSIVQTEGRRGVLRRPVLLHVGVGGTLALICLALWGWTARRYLSIPKTWKRKAA